ncbi:hypothetical protein PROFUN_02185 [Planoprotostelium fungivorum]|uniref:Uncharacterized protein n=1 Tax=Planoprotostelium fungivorum TaxID=1890364 RepID=A0A2P6NZD4_9EUKA|nr:hypothetical protein PROFUN_02185 [Planoprotostelium fungivorum]
MLPSNQAPLYLTSSSTRPGNSTRAAEPIDISRKSGRPLRPGIISTTVLLYAKKKRLSEEGWSRNEGTEENQSGNEYSRSGSFASTCVWYLQR